MKHGHLSSIARSAYSDLLRQLKDDMIANIRGSIRTNVRDGKTYRYPTEKIGTDLKWWYIGPDTEERR